MDRFQHLCGKARENGMMSGDEKTEGLPAEEKSQREGSVH